MVRILVADKIAEAGIERLRAAPGVIGLVGQAFGSAGINIADMALSRRGKTALMVLKLDEAMPNSLRNGLSALNPPILSVRTVTLPPVAEGPSAA